MDNKKNSINELLYVFKNDMICEFLDDEELENVSAYFDLVKFPAGTTVFNEGDPGDFIGFVVSGKLEVKKQTEFRGKQIVLALLSKGAPVGELSLFGKQTRSATVVSLEDTTMLILRNEAFEAFMEKYPYSGIKMLKAMIKILSIRLRKATERLAAIF